ncbi:MAG: endonuclease/exonuclease/phosphatase family protein [Clostridia bacterium]|nr:endonuclease/exonuclease/phosphatase family protein [Clostridia bacterium]
MKIMSFNAQHCLSFFEDKIDYQVMADAIKKCGADIVGLNEIYNKGIVEEFDNQTAVLAKLTGLTNYYFAEATIINGGNPYGNAFISKYPIISAETIPVPDPETKNGKEYYETRCLLKARIEGGITILVTHFGLNEDEQRNAMETVLKHLNDEKCILMGDFNMVPENEILKPIRKYMKDTADCFEIPLLSFPSDKPKVKIDYIFVSKDIEVVSAEIPAIIASDHRPHTAEVII